MPEEVKTKPADEQDSGVKVQEVAAPEDDTPADEAVIEVDEQGNEVKPNVKQTKPNADAGSKETAVQKQEETYTKAQVEEMMRKRLKETGTLKELVQMLEAEGYGSPEQLVAQLKARKSAEQTEKLETGDPTAIASVIESRINEHPAIQEAKRLTHQRQIETEIGELLRKYPDATKDEITQCFAHKEQEGLKNLKAAYLDLFDDAITQKARLRAQERNADSDKRGVESTDGAPTRTASIKAPAWVINAAKERVAKGEYKTLREAVEYLQGKREFTY